MYMYMYICIYIYIYIYIYMCICTRIKTHLDNTCESIATIKRGCATTLPKHWHNGHILYGSWNIK